MSVFPSNVLPYSHFHSKNSIHGNVGTDNQLKAIGSDTHFGFCREVQKADNRKPRASSVPTILRILFAGMLVLMTDWRPSAVTRISDSAGKYKRQIPQPQSFISSNHSKNSVRGNVGTDDGLKAVGSDTHFGLCREVQKADNRKPRASSFQPF